MKGGSLMKKVNILKLIASACLVLGNVANIINLIFEGPLVVYICTAPVFVAAIVLFCIVLIKQIKQNKRQNKDEIE